MPISRGVRGGLPYPVPVTEETLEVRMATTMTGRVSLAVWMGGVAREIDLLRQASNLRRLARPEGVLARNRLVASAACRRDPAPDYLPGRTRHQHGRPKNRRQLPREPGAFQRKRRRLWRKLKAL